MLQACCKAVGAERASLYLYEAEAKHPNPIPNPNPNPHPNPNPNPHPNPNPNPDPNQEGNQLACVVADGIRLQDPIRLQLGEADASLLGVAGASANELTPALALALALTLALILTRRVPMSP
eukprot:scaffold8753_cov38-Phaeocystis_antarctica.AAC.1